MTGASRADASGRSARSRRARFAACGLCLALAGCDGIRYRLNQPGTQVEAASTHIAVVAAAPWSRYEQALQPKFTLTPEAALQQAIPLTASYESRLVQALRFGLAAGLPRTGTTETVTRQNDAAGAQTRTESQETTLVPGTAPMLDPFLSTVPGAGTLGFPGTALEEDPFLQYSLANDLYQEVQILNRALADARLRREYDPYFLRMKVAAIPYRRDLTYDAYANIHLFERSSQKPTQDPTTCEGKAAEASATVADRLPFVVPLLVTDNVEFAKDAAAAQAITELALAVSAAVKGVAVDSKLQAVRDRLQTALANDQNSLRTVARLGGNAIRVRLGATFQADADGGKTFELFPRTHTISLLVLMPKLDPPPAGDTRTKPTFRTVDVVSRTYLRDVRRGELLTPSLDKDFIPRVDSIVSGFRLSEKFADRDACLPTTGDGDPKSPADWVRSPLRRYAFYGDWAAFNRELARFPGEFGSRDAQDLWTELTQLNGDLGGAATTVDLEIPQPTLPPTDQLVVLRDDGKARTSVQLTGGRDLLSEGIRAALLVGAGDEQVKLAPTAIVADGAKLSLEFPSLKGSKIVVAEGRAKDGVALKLAYVDATAPASLVGEPGTQGPPPSALGRQQQAATTAAQGGSALYGSASYVLVDPEKAAELDMAVPAERIVAVGGQGKVAVGVKLTPGSPARAAVVQLAGAEIEAASAGQIDPLGRLRLDQAAYVTLTLRNLEPGKPVTITSVLVQGDKPEGEKKTKALPVVAGKEPDKKETPAAAAAVAPAGAAAPAPPG